MRAQANLIAPAEGSAQRADVPFVTLDRDHQPLRGELAAAFERVVDASAFILGAEVEAFEAEWAAYCQVPCAVGVSSGTAALRIAFEAAGIGAGDEVLVPAHTFIASAIAVAQAGATPVFCDVLDETGLIDPSAAQAAVGERTAAILVVHLYGQVARMEALRAIADRRGLLLVEDAAQAQGSLRGSQPAGSLGDIAAFSFYPSKNLGALGDGGAICTPNAMLAEKARRLRNLGQRGKGEHLELAGNDRLDGLQAALLRAKLPHLDDWNAARRAVCETYREGLPPSWKLLHEDPAGTPNYHLFAVRVPARDAVAQELAHSGVQTGVHYTPAAYSQPPLIPISLVHGECVNADAWAAEELSLPMSPSLRRDEVERVLEACHDATHAKEG